VPTSFPTSLDTLTNPQATDPQNSPSHAGQHANANDAIEALEAKVGIDSSAVTTSLDYRVNALEDTPSLIAVNFAGAGGTETYTGDPGPGSVVAGQIHAGVGTTSTFTVDTGLPWPCFLLGAVADGGELKSSQPSSFAMGNVTTTGGRIEAIDSAAFAWGNSVEGGIITSSGRSSVAFGYAYGGSIVSSGSSSFAFGYSYGEDSLITATTYGAFAFGYAGGGGIITASGRGALAVGFTYGGVITASAPNTFQFGPGENSVEISLQVGAVGAGIHLHGNGTPGTPANGDIWCDGTDVFVRTGGATKNMSNI
jgi:hypothetical protein